MSEVKIIINNNPLRLDERSDLKQQLHTLNMIYWFCELCRDLDSMTTKK